MAFIRSGRGILVIPGVVGTAVAVGALGGLALRALGHPERTVVAVSLGVFAAAGVDGLVGRRLNATPPREPIDPATNQRVVLRRSHAPFWVPVQDWSRPVALAARVPLPALRTL